MSKILFFIIQPMVWVSSLLIFSILTKSSERRRSLIIASIAILFFFSNQFVFNGISKLWEETIQFPTLSDETYEVAIVLGGISDYDGAREQQAFFANSDRLLNILPLYFRGTIKKILFAGGSGKLTNNKIEAISIRDYLISIGVNSKDILIETRSRNTYENVIYSIEVLKKEGVEGEVLLSTSATHMYRSIACFEKQGFVVTPFSVDFISRENVDFSLDYFLLPDSKTMNHWYWLLHEWVGILSYKLMGYC